MIEPSRRGLLIGLGAIIAAPAVVRATSLMAIKPLPVIRPIWPFGEEGRWYRDRVRFVDGELEQWDGWFRRYLYADELSADLRVAVQPLAKFRQFAEGP